MGVSIAWLAVKTEDPASLIRQLHIQPAGEPDQLWESPMSGSSFNGWFLLIAKGCAHRFITDGFLADRSRGRDVVACSIEEHVMFSSAAAWRDARRIWSIVHDAQRGMLDLNVTGEPPASFRQIQSEQLAQQAAEGGGEADVDWAFEIPLHVAQRIVGFKHDETTEWTERAAFESYRDLHRPWWKFW